MDQLSDSSVNIVFNPDTDEFIVKKAYTGWTPYIFSDGQMVIYCSMDEDLVGGLTDVTTYYINALGTDASGNWHYKLKDADGNIIEHHIGEED